MKPVGRTKLPATVQREIRRTFHGYTNQLAEKSLAKALTGDGPALLACATLIVFANREAGQK